MSKHITSISLLIITSTFIAMYILLKTGYYSFTTSTYTNQSVDAFMIHANMRTYNTLGWLKNTLQSTRAEHKKYHDTTTFTDPIIVIHSPNKAPWHIQSKNGKSIQQGKYLLWGHVMLHQPQSNQGPTTDITTRELSYYPQKHYAISHHLTTIKRPGSTASGVGAIVNFTTGTTILLSKSKGVYQNRAH